MIKLTVTHKIKADIERGERRVVGNCCQFNVVVAQLNYVVIQFYCKLV